MAYLWIVSLLWAFSFGLIKTSLAGVDANLVAAARLGLAFVVFLPFLRWRAVGRERALRLVGVGAVQFGGMYLAYLHAFRYLQAHEVALFTILTPLYVTLIHDWHARRVNWPSLAAVCAAMAGAWIVKSGAPIHPDLLAGFWLVQLSNVCFAYGQIAYRRVMDGAEARDRDGFALLYLGGLAASEWSGRRRPALGAQPSAEAAD